jgi:hypothetical protein
MHAWGNPCIKKINIKHMTKNAGYDFNNYSKDTLTRPRDSAWSNWKSWKDAKVGDKLQGYIADAFYRPEEKNAQGGVAFRAQRGITIRLIDGTLQNLGVKDLSFILAATDNLRVGDPVTVELTKILPPASKGQQGAKVFAYFGANLPENASCKTVKQLTDEDRATGGTVEAQETSETDAEFDNIGE